MYRHRSLDELNWDRLDDYYHWLKMKHFLMSKDLEDEFLFIYACTAIKLESLDSVIKDLYKINREFVMKFSPIEMNSVVAMLLYSLSNHSYNFRNDTIIKKLGITPDQQKHLKTIISGDEALKRIKHDDKVAKQKARAERKERKLNRKSRNRKMFKCHERGWTYKKIAKKFGLKPSTVGNIIRTFKD